MKRISILLALSLLVVISTACKSEQTRQEKVSVIINKIDSPFFIATITPQNIIDKSGATDGVLPFTYETLVGFFMLEEETGIDNNTQVQLIAGKGSGIGVPNMYAIFKVNDPVKFDEMIEKELNATIKEKDGFKTIAKKKDNYVMVWNGEFAIAANVPINLASLFGGGDETGKSINRCIKLLSDSDDDEVNQGYVDFMNKEDDIAAYFDSEGLIGFLAGMDMIEKEEIKNMKEEYGGNTMESYLNFENGSVKWEHKIFLSDILTEKYNFINEKGINNKMFEYGNSTEPMLKYSLNINPQLTADFMKIQMKENDYEKFEEELKSKGYAVKDLVNTFTGEVLFMLDGFTFKTEMIDYGYGEPFEMTSSEPVMGVVMGVKDKSIFSNLPEEILVTENGIMSFEDGFYGVVVSDYLFASNDSAWVNKVIDGQTTKLKDEEGTLTKQPYGFYASFGNPNHAEMFKKEFPMAEILENVWGYANLSEAEINIVLKDKSQNSLRVITKYISDFIADEEMDANQDIKNMLDQEALESIEDGMETIEEGINEVEEALEDVDIEGAVNDILKEVSK